MFLVLDVKNKNTNIRHFVIAIFRDGYVHKLRHLLIVKYIYVPAVYEFLILFCFTNTVPMGGNALHGRGTTAIVCSGGSVSKISHF